MTAETTEWWRGALLYEVYLKSFADSDGDGEGDLPGLIARLDHIAALGVDGFWVTPFFPSPMKDAGYDISDYRAVDPRFGTMDDFRTLVEAAHDRGLKVVIDQVYSHSSDQHPWFAESRTSRDNPRADWYVWADPRPDGAPPNNWLGRFGGIAWEWEPSRRQYYLHNFVTEQPDLNLHNPEVQAEILDIARFWLDTGVDGLRLDVANFFMHDPLLRDNPPAPDGAGAVNPYYMQAHVYDRSRPENLPFLERLRRLVDAYPGRMTLAEISCDRQPERMAEYTAPGRLHTAYSFELLKPALTGGLIADALAVAGEGGGWPTWAFSNHDVRRVATRWGRDDPAAVRMLQALLLCLRGTIVVYQGEELGLPQSEVPRAALRDPEAIRFWPNHRGRDGARTPMPWDGAAPNLGFSTGAPWLPAEPAHAPLSVAAQERDGSSHLAHFRGLAALRRARDELRLGDFIPRVVADDRLVFERRLGRARLLCAFNFSTAPIRLDAPVGRSHAEQGWQPDARVLAPAGYLIAEPALVEETA